MRLISALVALCSMSTIFSHALSLSNGNSHNLTLTFDDLPPALRLTPLPTPSYHHLKFTSFSVFAPRSPFLKDYITPYDLNCAVSSPNALLGSRSKENGPGASFEITKNASTMMATEEGLQPYFTLLSLQLKPMVAPAPGVNVWIKGYRVKDDERVDQKQEPLKWNVEFPNGYHLPLLVDLERFSNQSWDRLHKVEIGADFGYDDLDWEFCLDDLSVRFDYVATGHVRGRQAGNQNLLQSDW